MTPPDLPDAPDPSTEAALRDALQDEGADVAVHPAPAALADIRHRSAARRRVRLAALGAAAVLVLALGAGLVVGRTSREPDRTLLADQPGIVTTTAAPPGSTAATGGPTTTCPDGPERAGPVVTTTTAAGAPITVTANDPAAGPIDPCGPGVGVPAGPTTTTTAELCTSQDPVPGCVPSPTMSLVQETPTTPPTTFTTTVPPTLVPTTPVTTYPPPTQPEASTPTTEPGPGALVDCGGYWAASGFPTTLAPSMHDIQCLIDAFEAGNLASFHLEHLEPGYDPPNKVVVDFVVSDVRTVNVHIDRSNAATDRTISNLQCHDLAQAFGTSTIFTWGDCTPL